MRVRAGRIIIENSVYIGFETDLITGPQVQSRYQRNGGIVSGGSGKRAAHNVIIEDQSKINRNGDVSFQSAEREQVNSGLGNGEDAAAGVQCPADVGPSEIECHGFPVSDIIVKPLSIKING